MTRLVPLTHQTPTLITSDGARAQTCFLEFFTAQIRNPNTRRTYP
jgi:hypothetical protein